MPRNRKAIAYVHASIPLWRYASLLRGDHDPHHSRDITGDCGRAGKRRGDLAFVPSRVTTFSLGCLGRLCPKIHPALKASRRDAFAQETGLKENLRDAFALMSFLMLVDLGVAE